MPQLSLNVTIDGLINRLTDSLTPIPLLTHRSSFKVTHKSSADTTQSPGVYRRISATKELLSQQTQEVRLRNSSAKKLVSHHLDGDSGGSDGSTGRTGSSLGALRARESASRGSSAQLLAAKMAEVSESLQQTAGNNWSNNVDDYEVGQVIGQTHHHHFHTNPTLIQSPLHHSIHSHTLTNPFTNDLMV
jgi:hypothetical protein